MSTVQYHGPVPVTKKDMKMAKKHLKDTEDLLEDKIDDHESAKEDAQEAGNQKSVQYNDTHLKGHQKDLTKVEKSLDTVKNLKPAVIKQVKKTPGLVNYVKKKRLNARAIATVAGGA